MVDAESAFSFYDEEDVRLMVEAGREMLEPLCSSIRHIGNADSYTQMGGLELHGKTLGEGLEAIAGAINRLARAIEKIGEKL